MLRRMFINRITCAVVCLLPIELSINSVLLGLLLNVLWFKLLIVRLEVAVRLKSARVMQIGLVIRLLIFLLSLAAVVKLSPALFRDVAISFLTIYISVLLNLIAHRKEVFYGTYRSKRNN